MSMDKILETIEENKTEIENMSFNEVIQKLNEAEKKPLYECPEFKINYVKGVLNDEHLLIIKHLNGQEIPLKLTKGTLSNFAKAERDKLNGIIKDYDQQNEQSETGIKKLLYFQNVSVKQFRAAVIEAYVQHQKLIGLEIRYRDLDALHHNF